MEILAVYVLFAGVVAIAARHRGRSDVGWFFLALIISPLIAIIILFVISSHPNGQMKTNRYFGTTTRVVVNRAPRAFEPEGVHAGVPYKINDDGSIDAVMHGSRIRFTDFDKFITMVK